MNLYVIVRHCVSDAKQVKELKGGRMAPNSNDFSKLAWRELNEILKQLEERLNQNLSRDPDWYAAQGAHLPPGSWPKALRNREGLRRRIAEVKAELARRKQP